MHKKRYILIDLMLLVVVLFAVTGCDAGTAIGDLNTQSETVELDDAESVTVEIEMGAGDLNVSGGAAKLLEADFAYNVDELAPEAEYNDGKLIVKHADTKSDIATLFDMDEYRNEWDLRFNEDVPMEMRIDIVAGRTDLKLGSLNLTSLDIKGDAGDVTVDLSGAPSLTELDFEMGTSVLLMDLTGDWTDDLNAAISAGVGDLTLHLPGTVGVRVDVKDGIGVVNAKNLAKDGDSYTNDAYGESDVTLRFEIKAGVGDINLEAEPAPVVTVPEPTPEAAADKEEIQNEEAAMFDEEIAAQLQAVLEEAVASPNTNYPGAVLHVSSPELGSWSGASGLGQVETSTPMRPHDKFRAGSLTKPFISVVILQLVEEGLFSLDDPLTAVLPEDITSKFANSDQITVRMLLSHTGGLPDYMNLAGPEIVANLEKIWEEEEFLDFAAAQEPLFAPGEAQAYSNTDYTLLGMVIEEATGRTWREAMRERIFESLNLENTFLPEPDDVTIPGDHAHGYADFGEGLFDATELVGGSVVGAAGGQSLVTNAEDLSRFVTAVAAGELFQEAGTMGEMLTFVDWPDGNPLSPYVSGYGLGLMQAPFGSGIEGVGHSGDTPGGYHSFVFYLPAQGMSISGAMNIDDFEAGYLLIPRALEVLLPGYAAPQQAAPEQPDLGAALQGLLDSQVQEQDILGMAMALQLADGTVIGRGSGYSDPAEKEAWGIDTQTKIGSVTKLFTAAVIMQLVEEGKLSLDDTIDTWFPDQPNGEEITVRMLLTHNSGIGRFVTVPEVMGKSAETWAPMDLVAEANKAGSVGEPGGSEGHYSNANYILLALIAEEISGNSWDQEVQSRIIEPLDLKDTLYPGEEGFPDTVVGGYIKSDAGYENQLGIENPSFEWSAGALVSTVSDLTTFTSALFNGDLFESEETLNQMLEPLVPMDMGDGFVVQYGLGPARADVEGGPLWGHAGDNIGYAAFVGFDPATGSVVSTAVNTHGGDALGPSIAALQYLRSVLGAGAEKEEPAMAFTPPITDAEGNEIPGSIAAIETVILDGFEQTITLRGVDATNPVLLFLHGGPGMPSSPWITWNNFQAELEEHFVVVHWDQRGAGKSFSEALTPQDMHVENFVSDTLELTDILRQRFEQDKIFLWGHSWGSGLGFETLSVNADPYHAYIASAVRPDWKSTQTMSYEWVLEQAQQQNDDEAIQALESLEPFDPTNLEHVGTKNHFLSLYRGQDFYTEGLGDEYFNYVLSGQSPEYSAADVENTLAGQGFTRQTLLPEIIQSGYDLYTDFPVSPIPVYFLAGRHDYETPGELSEEYFNFLEAPAKNFTWFENSAHNVMYDEPDKTNQELIRIANEVLDESVTEGAVQTTITPALLADLEAYIEQNRESLNVPGAAVAIVQGGEIVYAEGFGVKELGSDDPVTADTVFTIGSTGKAMTSMMAASLVDDGIIAWDTPLVEVMPQFQLSDETATQQITLREAFAHTSGLPQLGPVLIFSGLSPEDYVEYLATVPLAAPPGELYAYHNEMNAVGAYAAAMAAGAEYGENLIPTYTELMQERVFDPLEMSSATFSAQEAAASPNHATPHFMGLNATLAETGFDVTPTHYWDIDTFAPAGTVRMNAPDVGRFLIAMLSGGLAPDGSRVISTENLAETWTEQIAREPDPFLEKKGSGLGWTTATYQGIPIVSKDGNSGGFFAQMAFIPEADTGIVVLANADGLGTMLGRNVQYRLIEMLFGLEPLIDQVATAELEGIGGASEAYSQLAAVDPETVAPFLGSYDIEGEPYSVELRDDRLWVSMGELDFIELLAAPDGSYMAVSGGGDFLFAPFQFVEGDDGQISMVIFGQLELPKLD